MSRRSTPRNLINSKTFSSAIDYFFGRGELSQVVDQTNPLSQLTHERRLSALGPGGLNRKRAGFEVRDVHISHYGRLCPIETPEGSNIGLISSLAIYSALDDYGFLTTPYVVIKNGKVTTRSFACAPTRRTTRPGAGRHRSRRQGWPPDRHDEGRVIARVNGDPAVVESKDVHYMDVSTKQIVGVSAALIPFLEHDDANRALMGSNMQRQAVPLLTSESRRSSARAWRGRRPQLEHGGLALASRARSPTSTRRASRSTDEYKLTQVRSLNERTCQNQTPIVKLGQKVKAGPGARRRRRHEERRAGPGQEPDGRVHDLGRLQLRGRDPHQRAPGQGRRSRRSTSTSTTSRSARPSSASEEFTRDIPNVSEKALANLDEAASCASAPASTPGDILVGKVAPKSKSELTPEEKLLHAIFGKRRRGREERVADDADGHARRRHRRPEVLAPRQPDGLERTKASTQIRDAERVPQAVRDYTVAMLKDVKAALGSEVTDDLTGKQVQLDDTATYDELRACATCAWRPPRSRPTRQAREVLAHRGRVPVEDRGQGGEKNKIVNRLSRGDELPTGVLEMVKVYVATKRRLSVGDKMAGRHGNKGVISKILPVEDMPFLEDGTPVDIVLNPLGVPSRMNVGQILETHLGLGRAQLGLRVASPVFDGASEADIEDLLRDAKAASPPGKSSCTTAARARRSSRTSPSAHVHAEAAPPRRRQGARPRHGTVLLITQQPLGGKARFGGQRFGEMEVWALEAYGAAASCRNC
jgi:DNA-directed RNA polymerase subunit beta